MARAALHFEFELFRGSTDEICRRKLYGDGKMYPLGHAGFVVVRRAGGGDSAGADCFGNCPGGCRMFGRRSLCQFDQTRTSRDFWNVAFRV